MTGQEEEPRIILDKPVPINADFVDFDIEREDWNKYKLADNTLLKARFVLLGVLMDKSLDELRETLKKPAPDQTPKIGFGFRSQYVFSIEPPKNYEALLIRENIL